MWRWCACIVVVVVGVYINGSVARPPRGGTANPVFTTYPLLLCSARSKKRRETGFFYVFMHLVTCGL